MKRFAGLIILSFSLLSAAGLSASSKQSYQHYLRALLLTNQGQYEEALQEYETALRFDPQSSFLYRQAAELALEVGRVERAFELAQRFLELSPKSPEAHFLLGNIHWARGELDLAQKDLETTLELQPGHQSALLALGNLLGAQSPEKAKKYLEDYIAENPSDASEALYHIALIEQRAGKVLEAMRRFRASIEADPHNMQSRYSLAQLFEVRQDTRAALGEYLEILRLDPRNVLLINHVGEMHFREGRVDEARRFFLQARDVVPSHPASCLWLAILAEERGDFPAAVGHVRASAALPEDPALNLRLSYYLTQSDKLPEAVKTLEQAHARWPNNDEIAYFLSLGYDDVHQPEKAAKLMERVLELRPEHRDARFQLGALYEKQGNMAKAEEQFRALLDHHPNDASALNYLGYSLADRGLKLEEAEALIARAVELDPKNGAFRDSLGWVHFKKKRFSPALEELVKACELMPQDDTIWDHLGEVYSVSGDTAAAWTAWKRSQLLSGGKPEVENKLASLEARFPPEVLGAMYLDLLKRNKGSFDVFGGPCAIEGRIGRGTLRFQGMLHYRAPWDLSVEVLGPLFVPVFRAGLIGEDGFEMDPLDLEGVSPERLQETFYDALRLLRAYLMGSIFETTDVRYHKGWRKSRVEVPGAQLFLDKARVRLREVRENGRGGFRLELSEYRPIEGHWVPSHLKLEGEGVSLTFRFSGPSVRFE